MIFTKRLANSSLAGRGDLFAHAFDIRYSLFDIRYLFLFPISSFLYSLSSALFPSHLLLFLSSHFLLLIFSPSVQQSGHLTKYALGEDLNKAPPCNPNPPAVDVILTIISHPQSEHLSFNSMVVFPGSASNIFLNISIKSPSCPFQPFYPPLVWRTNLPSFSPKPPSPSHPFLHTLFHNQGSIIADQPSPHTHTPTRSVLPDSQPLKHNPAHP